MKYTNSVNRDGEKSLKGILEELYSDLQDSESKYESWNYDGHEADFGTTLRDLTDSDYDKAIKSIEMVIEEAKAEERKRCLEALPKKREPLEYYLKSRMQEHIGFNQALTVAEESIKKLDQISQSIKEK